MSVVAALVALIVAARPAAAHELIVKPAAMTATAGSQLGFAVLSSHVFITSQELEEAQDVRAGVVIDGKRREIPLRPDEGSLSYLGPAHRMRTRSTSSRRR
jgi:hypothetical protein